MSGTVSAQDAYAALAEFVQKLGYGSREKPVTSIHAEGGHITVVWIEAEARQPPDYPIVERVDRIRMEAAP